MAVRLASTVVIWAFAALTAGCGLHRHAGDPAAPDGFRDGTGSALAEYIAEVRRRSLAPVTRTELPTAESLDPGLREAVNRLTREPGAAAHRAVAEHYFRLGIMDAAFDHYSHALRSDRRDAAAYDGLARVFREWGAPDRALTEASRATYHAPRSAAARNTLGTLLYALGQRREARLAFEQALTLEPEAGYAANNLCYVTMAGGDLIAARHYCRRALELSPTLLHARNNLGVALAVAGDVDAALDQFRHAGPPGTAEFNLGIVLAADGRFAEAARWFDAAARHRPGWEVAEARAAEARSLGRRTRLDNPLHDHP